MNKNHIWMCSLCFLIIIILFYIYYSRYSEGFTEVVTPTSIKGSITSANTALAAAKQSISTANTATTNATTIPLAKIAIEKATIAVKDAMEAVNIATIASGMADILLFRARRKVSEGVIANLTSSKTTALQALNAEKEAAGKKAAAWKEWTDAKTEQANANGAVANARSDYNTENSKLTPLQQKLDAHNDAQAKVNQAKENVDKNKNDLGYYTGTWEGSATSTLSLQKYQLGRANPNHQNTINQLREAIDRLQATINDWRSDPNPLKRSEKALDDAKENLANYPNNTAEVNAQKAVVAAKETALAQANTRKTNADAEVPKKEMAYTNLSNGDVNAKQDIYDNIIAYNDALIIQTNANTVKKDADQAKKDADKILTDANTKATTMMTSVLTTNKQFMDAAISVNTITPVNEFTSMSIAWTAYTGTPIPSTTSITAENALFNNYSLFIDAKTQYINIITNKLTSFKSTEATFISKNRESAEDLNAKGYMNIKVYNDLVSAFDSIKLTDPITDVLKNYNTYIIKKRNFEMIITAAQGNKAQADFISKLNTSKENMAQWIAAAPKGCRRIQTIATTDSNMLDQDIVCSENEYISGYSSLRGYDAAPADPNVSRDNIEKYLAVKYACCTVPTGTKGSKGKTGLPGLEGNSGPIGLAGPVGPDGPAGNKGVIGDIGEEGGKGPMGDPGENGTMGEQGPPGKPGTSIRAPYIRQLPGTMGPPGKMGPRGIRGPKGADGKIEPAPVQPPSQLDKTIALINIQDKLDKYIRSGSKKK